MSDTQVTLLTPAHVAHDAAADAALAIHGHGFADEVGDTSAPGGHHTLATVSRVTLLNLGETEIAQRFEDSFGEATLDVHVITDTHGLTQAYYGPQGLPQIEAGFERAVEAYARFTEGLED